MKIAPRRNHARRLPSLSWRVVCLVLFLLAFAEAFVILMMAHYIAVMP